MALLRFCITSIRAPTMSAAGAGGGPDSLWSDTWEHSSSDQLNQFRPVQTGYNQLRPNQFKCSNRFRPVQTSSNWFRHVQTRSNQSKPDQVKPVQTSSNQFRCWTDAGLQKPVSSGPGLVSNMRSGSPASAGLPGGSVPAGPPDLLRLPPLAGSAPPSSAGLRL